MLALAHWLATLTTHTYAVVEGDSIEFQSCCYFSLLGLIVSLAFLHLEGPGALTVLASAG
jgi:hypothetical protein